MLSPKIHFGCVEYCPNAVECFSLRTDELESSATDSLVKSVEKAMKRYFGVDYRRICHAVKVAYYAGEINRIERGDSVVVPLIAYLHDIGIKEAERKFNSSSAKYQHQEGPPVAREILTQLGADELLIAEVCDIIGHHHHPRKEETINFKVLYDADLIVNLDEAQQQSPSSQHHLEKIVAGSFLTEKGRQMAADSFLLHKAD
jgi:hypothetical protein